MNRAAFQMKPVPAFGKLSVAPPVAQDVSAQWMREFCEQMRACVRADRPVDCEDRVDVIFERLKHESRDEGARRVLESKPTWDAADVTNDGFHLLKSMTCRLR